MCVSSGGLITNCTISSARKAFRIPTCRPPESTSEETREFDGKSYPSYLPLMKPKELLLEGSVYWSFLGVSSSDSLRKAYRGSHKTTAGLSMSDLGW